MKDERDIESLVADIVRRRITRRQLIARGLAIGMTASAIGSILAACGGREETAASPSAAMDTTKPEQLFLFNWSDSLPGAVKRGFRDEFGIEVVESYFDDNEALLAKLKAGARGYDLISPTDYMVHIMIKTGLLEPLDMSYIPNFAGVEPSFQKPAFDPEDDGKKYSVPIMWGTTGVAQRVDQLENPITKWSDLWNPAYKNEISMLDDERETPGAALKMLGYSLNSQVPDEVDAAIQKLIEQKSLVHAYDSVSIRRSMVAGEVPLVHAWSGDVMQAEASVGDGVLAYILPEEGYTIYIDTYAIPVGAESPYAAHLFMDYCLRPEVQALITNYTGFLNTVPAAQPMIDEAVQKYVPDAETLQRGEIINDVGEAASLYSEGWRKVKNA